MLMLDIISDGLRTMFAFLCKYIYELIAILYDLFINISKVEILSSKQIEPIYQRVTMILTIVMVFYVTFEAVKFVVQPEQFSDKEKGAQKIVLKMILVVILIAFIPKIFGWANDIQNKIFDNQVLSKVILGNKDVTADKFGKNIAYNIFSMFYNVNDTDFSTEELEEGTKCDGMPCKQVVTINLYQLQREGNIPIIYSGLNTTGKINEPTTSKEVDSYYINFNGLLATLVGGFIAWILLLYCVDVGVRVVQLVFLQIIAPIPIMAYLSPKKDGMFEKWAKQCMTTYLDVFLRLAVIYFVLLICEILGEAMVNNTLVGSTGDLNWAVYVALILGLLLFAKKAPDLLKELFPKTGAASGNFGLKGKDRFAPAMSLVKPAGRIAGAVSGAVIGAGMGVATGIAQGARRAKALKKDGTAKGVGAGIWGATKGAVGGLVGGTARGIYHGSKKGNVFKNSVAGAQKQVQANKLFGNKEENGYGFGNQIGDKARSVLGVKSRTEAQEAKKSPIKRQDEALKYITDTESSIKKRALEKLEEGSASDAKTKTAAEDWTKKKTKLKDLEDPMSEARKNYQVGSVKDDSASIQGYQNELTKKNAKISAIDTSKIASGITDDSLGIDKNNFRMTITEQQYDALAHEKAKSKFIKDTGKLNEDGTPIMEFDEAAWKASKAEFTAPKVSEIFDEQSYKNALKEARSRKVEEIKNSEIAKIESEFEKNVQSYVYQTTDEAESALASAKNKAAAELDDAQKAVVAAYVANEGDGAIKQMITELRAHIDGDENGQGGYNSTASTERKLTVDYEEITNNFKAFSDKVKKDDNVKYPGNYRSIINQNAADIINIDTEIDKIKRQTEGSQDKK